MIRRDLETVKRLAAEAAAGRPGEELRAEIDELKTNGPLWQLKVNCLRYCRFVHSHHHTEDVAFFPLLRRTNPEIDPVVDRLESEHREVATQLDRVEGAARELTQAEGDEARRRLVDSLDRLAEGLLIHLSFEEESIGPTVRRVRSTL